jgi:predicted dehydrogenase
MTGEAIRFMTLDPGHFHAALVHKEMYDDVDPRVTIYSRQGPDLVGHLGRMASFNNRLVDPTGWELEVHIAADCLERLLAERPGNVVVLSGRNLPKIGQISASLGAGLHVLADKPWIIRSEDLAELEAALECAERKALVAYDIMTERYEITTMAQKALVNDPAVFGRALAGSPDQPGVEMRSVHHIMKMAAGAPIRRPVWFFDVREQGEALGDVGTHLVDLVPWTLFPEEGIDYRGEIEMIGARRWPTPLTAAELEQVTGEYRFPDELAEFVRDGRLEFHCNTRVSYALRGIHVRLDVLWDYQSEEHGDTHHAIYRGDKAAVEVRQGAEEGWQPETYVIANEAADRPAVLEAVCGRVQQMMESWPGIGVEDLGERVRVTIPEKLRNGHEAHFGQVTRRFLEYLRAPGAMPGWEKKNMLAKYYVTTMGTDLSRKESSS